MNPEIKAQWIDALRSGEYQQTKGKLRNSNGFCCLGVLTDLYVKETNQEWTYSKQDEKYEYLDCGFTLPEKVMVLADLDEEDPKICTEDSGCTLAHYNDSKGYTFNQIADLIEENL